MASGLTRYTTWYGNRPTGTQRTGRSAETSGTGDPASGQRAMRLSVRSTASRNSVPRPGRFSPYHEGSFEQFSGRLRFRAKRSTHRLAKRPAMRARTSGQGSPAESAASTRHARLSTSRAQAACTAAESSVTGSSRLASSSAATVARSSGGRASVEWPLNRGSRTPVIPVQSTI